VRSLQRLIFVLCTCTLFSGAAFACRIPADITGKRDWMEQLINQERQKNGLRALPSATALEKAAQDHACDNADQRRISHKGSDGSDLRTRFRRAGYRFRAGNENVGNYPATAHMFEAWMSSSGHRANILDRNVTEIGVGVAMGDDNRLYWVTNGGAPR
jgi:uncharacterized protein YkwD